MRKKMWPCGEGTCPNSKSVSRITEEKKKAEKKGEAEEAPRAPIQEW